VNGITSHAQQGNKKNDDTKKMFHGASEVGLFLAHRRHFCTRLHDVGGAGGEHPSRKGRAR
jgi:hypothetical protein